MSLKPRIKPILQAEFSECGLACLAMLCNWYGKAFGIRELRQRYPVAGQTMSLKQLGDAATDLGFVCRGVRLELDELAQVSCPCILHWGMSHYVVLERIQVNATGAVKKAIIVDPARGELSCGRDELSKMFTGVAMELQPTQTFKAAKPKIERLSLGSMLSQIRGLGRVGTYVFLIAAAIELIALVSPLFLQWIVDTALVSLDMELMWVLAVGFAAMTILQVVLGFARSRIVLHASTRIGIQWSTGTFSHLLRLPLEYFHKRNLGEISSRFGSVSALQRVLSQNFVESVIDGLMAVMTLAALFLYSTTLATVVSGVVIVYALLRIGIYASVKNATVATLNAQAQEQTLFLETVQSMQAIKLFGKESQRQQAWAESMVEARFKDAKLQSVGISVGAVFHLLFGIETVVVIAMAGTLVMRGDFTVGMIYAFLAYKNAFLSRSQSLIDKLIDFRMLSIHLDRLADIVLEDPEPTHERGGLAVRPLEESVASFTCIEFRSVWFRYSSIDQWVLQNLNFTIKLGQSLAIIGPSGQGKSTVLKLLLGTLKPTHGDILIDGLSIEAYGIQRFRRLFGTVMQDDCLLSGTISDNICFFDALPNDKQIVACAVTASIHDDIVRMPLGYGTLVGELGTTLSGGQKQRVMLARALYNSPQILLMDEATSHLDSETESRVNSHIEALNITKIVVSHRIESIRGVDKSVDLTPVYTEERPTAVAA